MSLIPKISLSEFKKATVAELRAKGSVEVTADGESLFIAVVPIGDNEIASFARESAIQVAFRNLSIKPKDSPDW